METKKYIIEIPDNTAWLQWVKVSDKDGHVCFDFKDPEDLTPYTEPDTEQVRKEAYDKGYQDANVKISSNEQAIAEKAYQRGLIDAWDAARKIIGDDIPTSYLVKMFGNDPYSVICRIFDVYSASEAIEKIRQYEQEKEESVTTVGVMRQYLDIFCKGRICKGCPLNTPDFTCGHGYLFLTENRVSDEEVRRAYTIALAKMKEES